MKTFKQFITEKYSDKIYNKVVSVTDSGPFDGGCVYFAKSLQKVIGGELIVLVKNDIAQHAAISKDGYFIDYEDKLQPKQFIKSFSKKEDVEIAGYRKFNETDLSDAIRGTDKEQNELADMIKGSNNENI